jgi:hypothetical protein
MLVDVDFDFDFDVDFDFDGDGDGDVAVVVVDRASARRTLRPPPLLAARQWNARLF